MSIRTSNIAVALTLAAVTPAGAEGQQTASALAEARKSDECFISSVFELPRCAPLRERIYLSTRAALLVLPSFSWQDVVGASGSLALLGGTAGALRPSPGGARQVFAGPSPGALTVEPPAPFSLASKVTGLATILETGDRLRIRRSDGTRASGRYAGIDSELLVSVDDQIVRFRDDELSSIGRRTTHHPSWKKGALIGALVDAGLVGIEVAVEQADPEGYPTPRPGVRDWRHRVYGRYRCCHHSPAGQGGGDPGPAA